MPTKTFGRLTDERQHQILEASLEEFALHDYESASVSNIVKRLGISSNGTFFRYFETKKDLYFWLLHKATEKRLKEVQALFASADSMYELLVQNFYHKIQFDLQYPLYGQFLYNSLSERNSEELGNLMQITLQRITELVKQLIISFQKKGQLRSDLDLEIMAFTIVQIQTGVYDFLVMRYHLNLPEAIRNRNPLSQIPAEEVMDHVRAFARLLVEGIQKRD